MTGAGGKGESGGGGARRTRGRRADARRNASAILDAAQECLARDPDAGVSAIATAAGVGRVTLYGHFPSRTDLVDAVFARAMEQAETSLGGVDLGGDPRAALVRLVASSWQIIARYHALLAAVQREIPAERVRAHHERPLRRIEALLDHGRADGVFRADLPTSWLVGTFYAVMHGAADEIAAERLAAADAARHIAATLLAAFTPPGVPVPAAPDIPPGPPPARSAR